MRLQSTILDSILKLASTKEASMIDNMKEKLKDLINRGLESKRLSKNEYDRWNRRIESANALQTLEYLNDRVLKIAKRRKAQVGSTSKSNLKKKAVEVVPEKIMATLQKGLPDLVTTLNMSATQAESIYKVRKDQKNAHRAYKKLVFAANLVQESLTLIGKIKLVKEQPKPEPESVPVQQTQIPVPETKPSQKQELPVGPQKKQPGVPLR